MKQVLVVDDSLSVRKALEIILKPLSYTVRMADSGEAALAALGEAKVDLVIADVLMPGISGFELCEHIKTDPLHAQTPVVLISGIVSDEERAQATSVGAVQLVKKPFRAEDLLPVVQTALAGRPDEHDAPAAAPSLPSDGLLDALLSKQGIVSALVTSDGKALARRGDPLPDEDTLCQYVRFFASALSVVGTHLEEEWSGALLEYGKRSLLVAPLTARHTLLVVLKDAGASNVAKYVVKTQRPQFEAALSLN
ncbi:response regulator [Deinococcus yavapaiensis]|uniref:Response regulator receiver domain-containing protein n=1 Tax=Deinococcus yavapaiensis KR-236 TaxID=694435 RepID=A0A318SGW3_9DEIO|nr:response regulator [Deinococcus yavapaiensis]PYE56644.1 response regulator receiver domain-containing protein [Deinococcus yavapaiensis KR-236]